MHTSEFMSAEIVPRHRCCWWSNIDCLDNFLRLLVNTITHACTAPLQPGESCQYRQALDTTMYYYYIVIFLVVWWLYVKSMVCHLVRYDMEGRWTQAKIIRKYFMLILKDILQFYILNKCFLSELHTATQVYCSSAATLARWLLSVPDLTHVYRYFIYLLFQNIRTHFLE